MARSDDYRYTVDLQGSEITPLAQVEAYFGTLVVRVHNISQGGMAVIFDGEAPVKKGDVIDVSVSIRGRAIPVQVEIKDQKGLRCSCAFVNASVGFQAALREFLRPKFLGGTMQMNAALSGRQDVLELVENAKNYEVYLGQNQSGVFVWTDFNRYLLKLVAVSRDLVFEWTQEHGIKTGRLVNAHKAAGDMGSDLSDGIKWDRHADVTLVHYFADIFIPWLKNDSVLVERLTSGEPLAENEAIVFPRLK